MPKNKFKAKKVIAQLPQEIKKSDNNFAFSNLQRSVFADLGGQKLKNLPTQSCLDDNQLLHNANETSTENRYTINVPKFYTHWNSYNVFDEVAGAVTLIARQVARLGLRFLDKNGNEGELDFSNKLELGLKGFIESACMHQLVYGQTIASIYKKNKESEDYLIRLIPSHQCILWIVKNFEIDSFYWLYEGVQKQINPDSFYVLKNPSLTSKFFGDSPLNSFYDELNSINLDIQTFNKFLENNSFFGVAVMVKDSVDQQQYSILSDSIRLLASQENRYKAVALQGVDKLEQIKQGLEHKLTLSDKQYIKDSLYQLYGIPTFFSKGNEKSGGMGKGEQLTNRQNLKEFAIEPMQDKVVELFNSFILPIFYPDHTAVANEMQVENLSDIVDKYMNGYYKGLWTAREVKEFAFKVKKEELKDEDNFRTFTKGTIIVKKGELQQGDTDVDKITGNEGEKIDDTKQITDPIVEAKSDLPKTYKPKITNPFRLDFSFVKVVETQSKKIFSLKNIPDFSPKAKKQVAKFLGRTKNLNKDYGLIDSLLLDDNINIFKNKVKEVLQKQYKLDITKLYKTVESQATNEDQKIGYIYDNNNIESFVNDNLQNETNDWSDTILSYLYFANIGKTNVLNQAIKSNKEITQNQREQINKNINQHIVDRLNAISGLESNSELPNSIQKTTKNNVVKIVQKLVSNNPNVENLEELQNEYDELINDQIQNRSILIAENEATDAYQNGQTGAGNILEPKQKQWLPSVSKEPRLNHTPLYGEIVDIDKPFSIGYDRPNTEVNCKCDMRYIF